MGYEENDESLIPEIQELLDEFVSEFDNLRIKTLLSGEYDLSLIHILYGVPKDRRISSIPIQGGALVRWICIMFFKV